MAKIGDRVQVTIQGPAMLSGTATLKSGQIAVSGTIVADESDQWIVKLDISFDGRNLVRLLKSALAEKPSGRPYAAL